MKTFQVTFSDNKSKEIIADDYMQHGFFIEFTKETENSWEVVDRLFSSFIKRITIK